MEFKDDTNGDIAILRIKGRFDAYEVSSVASWLETASDRAPAHIIVDLSKVNFIDSTALATLVKWMKRCRQKKGDLYLTGLQQPVRVIFELTRLDSAFEIFANENAAAQAFRR